MDLTLVETLIQVPNRKKNTSKRPMNKVRYGGGRRQKCADLKEVKRGNKRYTKVVAYRLYWLNNRKSGRRSYETEQVPDYRNRMELTLKKQNFAGHDPTRVLLPGTIRERAQHLGYEKKQAIITLPSSWEGSSLGQYESAMGVATRKDEGVSS